MKIQNDGTAITAAEVRSSVAWRPVATLLGLLVLAGYFIYAWFVFDISSIIARAEPARAVLLATDSVAHKVHVTRFLRRPRLEVSVEGEHRATYATPPDWVAVDGMNAAVDLGEGYSVEIKDQTATFIVPGYGTITATATPAGVDVVLPPGQPKPNWIKGSRIKFDARPTLGRRVQVSRAKIEVHRYFFGWEHFWFPFGSPLQEKSWGELYTLVTSGERIEAAKPNWQYIFDSFWYNQEWQHNVVFKAVLETLLMAVLGTLTALIFGLTFAFLAASNFTPSMVLRFFLRRAFDFLRGIDMLIWSLIFIRAFGLGPLTGALAIAFTDTGTFGKLFSEALENIDKKQVEGVAATGASPLQRYRFGVIPQILPVFVSQALYYLESNTRSATVIGALGAGGIGLLLVETINTSRDWENTLYIIILTIVLVILMDMMSSWLRRRLINN